MNQTKTAIFGNGCFWCTEAIFQRLKGVISVQSGYSGGHTDNPDYESVCTGTTGHAECLRIEYDPAVISFTELLEVFWLTHDPTTLNRQGNDIGTQYRSVVFFENEEQKEAAQKMMASLNAAGSFGKPIVTTLEPLTAFFPAEDYHQDYFNQHGHAPYCQYVIRPKLEKFRAAFQSKLST